MAVISIVSHLAFAKRMYCVPLQYFDNFYTGTAAFFKKQVYVYRASSGGHIENL